MRTSLVCGLVAAVCLHVGPVAWKAVLDQRFQLGASAWLVLASMCLLQISLTTVPGRFGGLLARFVLLVFALTAIGNMLTISIFHHPVTFSVLSTTIQSNAQEAAEFFTIYGVQFALGAVLGLALALVVARLYKVLRRSQSFSLSATALLLSVGCGVPLAGTTEGGLKRLAHEYHELAYGDRLVTTLVRYAGITRDRARARSFWSQHRQQHRRLEVEVKADRAQPQLVVVVIGESTTRWHMGLYGYRRPTTAHLEAMREQLLVFSEVTAPVANTLPGVLGPLCSARFDPTTLACDGPTLLDIAREGGYRTVWISNQVPGGFGDNFIAELGRTAETSIFVNQDVSSAGEADHGVSLDEKVLAPLHECIRGAAVRKTMVFVHLMGTHFLYEKRYPPHRAVFRLTDDLSGSADTRALINHYDNAVAYQDELLGEMLSGVNGSGLSAVLVYFSDHGEEVYDSEDFAGHSQDRTTAAMQDVPFVIGFSPSSRRSLGVQWEHLKAREHAKLSTFELTPLVTELLGLELRAFDQDDDQLHAGGP